MIPFVVTGVIVIVVFIRLRQRDRAKVPEVYGNNELKKEIVEGCDLLSKVYYPPPWCESGTVETVAGAFIRSKPTLPYEREMFMMPDGGEVSLDWLRDSEEMSKHQPLVIILPGITGCSRQAYVLHLAEQLRSVNNYAVVVFNNRGCGGVPFKTRQIYSSAYTDDLEIVVKYIKEKHSGVPLYAVGFSLGGMVLFNYISKCGQKNRNCLLDGAMTISSPWNAHQAISSLQQPWPRLIFNKYIADSLRSIILPSKQIFEEHVNVEVVLQCRSLREFDTHFTVPLFNYPNLDAYYQDASFSHKIGDVKIPTLCLNAADDYFAPVESIPFDVVEQSSHVTAVVTSHGGHVAFLPNQFWPSGAGFAEELACQYLRHLTGKINGSQQTTVLVES